MRLLSPQKFISHLNVIKRSAFAKDSFITKCDYTENINWIIFELQLPGCAQDDAYNEPMLCNIRNVFAFCALGSSARWGWVIVMQPTLARIKYKSTLR